MVEFLKFIWQLPQNIAALTYYLYLRFNGYVLDIYDYGGIAVIVKSTLGSVTLGANVFVSYRASEETRKHELGHTKQSVMLGPLYLIVIGIPSILWAATHKVIAPNKPYDWFFTEAWASKLGKVIR